MALKYIGGAALRDALWTAKMSWTRLAWCSIGAQHDVQTLPSQLYEKELRAIFARFDNRAIELKRERWQDYVDKLERLYSREQILKEYGAVLP